ncbi:MAG: PAS domain S-box protein [Planctomycetes bacterium]|nr:PAS domain S-box protein [Planctomycetota bacterium]
MTNSGSNKSHIKRSKTSLQRRKKSERIGSDATEQKMPNNQDSKQEEMYKTLIENIPCAVYSAFPGERGPTTFMSQNWKDWTGYSAEEFYQDPEAWPECIYPEDREKAVNAYVEACNNEASYNLEYRIVHRGTGQVRYVRDQGLLSKDAKGTLVRVDGNITDITEVKTSENELDKYRDHLEELVKERTTELEKANEVLQLQAQERKKAAEALHESENRYKAVVENAAEGIVVVQDRMLKFVNPVIRTIMGYTEEELMSKSFIEFVHPDDREQVMDIHLKRNKGEEVPPVYECRIVDKQGNAKWAENNGILIEWEGRDATLNFLRDVTERKKTEEELKKQSIEYKRAQEIGKIGSFTVDFITREQKWSDEIFHILGLESGETQPNFEVFIECVHPEDKELLIQKSNDTFAGKADLDYQYRIIRKDGEVRFVHTQANVENGQDGMPLRIYGFSQDITEREKAEASLRESEIELDTIFNSSPVAMILLDANEAIQKANLAAITAAGRKLGDIRGLRPGEAFCCVCNSDDPRGCGFGPECKACVVHLTILDTLETGNPHDQVEVVITAERDGIRMDQSLLVSTTFLDIAGCPHVLATFQNITDRKKAEDELKENEERFRSLSNAAFEGIVVTKEGRFVDANAAFTNLFGYEPDEITGKEVMMLVAPGDRKLVMEHIQSGYEKSYEHKALCKDGSILDVEVCGRTVLIKGQECRITAVRDITERKKAEEKLLDYQAKLKSLASQLSLTEESERRRIATELHDQIGQSLVFSKIKLDELHSSATSSELTKALDEICNNIERIIQDTRTLTFDLSSPILNEIGLEAAVAEWLDVQVGEKHSIETEFVDDGQQKPLDDDIRALLFRNVRELLVNVIKHADAHKVKVSFRRINEHIHIDVEDDGKGFDSVKAISTGIEDTKFGLFSIRQRLEQLGGHFEIDTEEGRGSKIMMTAPLKLSKSKK